MDKQSAIHPLQMAAAWPVGIMPLALWSPLKSKTILPTAIKLVKPEDFFNARWKALATSHQRTPRYIGLVPYDAFNPFAFHRELTLIFEIHECLVWDDINQSFEQLVTGQPEACPMRLTKSDFAALLKDARDVPLAKTKGQTLLPALSDESYLSQIQDVLTGIRRGDFYQLNLLRWFRLKHPWTWHRVCERVMYHGGPYSSLFRYGRHAVVSLSPERFIAIESQHSTPTIITWPIKGTAARDLTDDNRDLQIREELTSSLKDRAELNMIVDLMRNDLHRICEPASVEVLDPGQLQTFGHVHHLQACVAGQLQQDITMGSLFESLCPGGSITGAPKRSVMAAIHQLEGCERGYAMGNAFVMMADGSFDSSILIRTLVSNDDARTWSYAAGSGIVIKSDPHKELAEVTAKCRPLTD